MSILKEIFCREKVRVLPVEIKENDYLLAVENNTRRIYGDKFSQYGYIYKNSIVVYQVERFAEQDSQTQMAALLFEVQFFAHTIYPPYNVPIDCEIRKKKQSSDDDQITMFLLEPIVILSEITRKFYTKNPIFVQVEVKTKDIEDQEKYKIGHIVKGSIHMGQPQMTGNKCAYRCLGTIKGIKTDAFLYKKIENYEDRYIEKKNKLLGQKKKQRNNQGNIEEMQDQEQSLNIDLDQIDSESEQSESENKKSKENMDKKGDQEKIKKKKVRIYTGSDQDQESDEEYDTEEEEEEEEEEGEEEDDLIDYELDDEEEEGEKEEEPEPEEEVE